MHDLFTEKSWIGEFFFPDSYEQRFFGKIKYSLEEGVILSYAISGHNILKESEVIYGVLDSGDKCTLFGRFNPKDSGFTNRNGLTVYNGEVGFYFLAIGDFIPNEDLIFKINFTLSNLQEFFFPSGFKDRVKFSDEPIYSLETSFGRMTVDNAATFSFLNNDIGSQIYSRDIEAVKELEESFNLVRSKFPQSIFMLKKDISYRIHLTFTEGNSLHEAYKYISELSDLLALLIYTPVYPESIHIIRQSSDEHPITIELYPSLALDARTIKLSKRNHFHWHMPISQSTVSLNTIVDAWFRNNADHTTIISSIQNETGFRDTHSAYGEIVLYATQLESISHNANMKDRKYEFPLREYGCQRVHSGLRSLFNKETLDEIGKSIGELRNEIAHVGRPKCLLSTLSLRKLIDISQHLQLVIIGYILSSIDVPKDIITRYQEKFLPDLTNR